MTSRGHRDPYIVLGVPRQASGEEIARAYRRAARASHPDSASAGSAERFRAVSDAYEVLRDPRRRAVYDRSRPLARPRTADAGGASVRYVAPGSQHLVLGPDTRSVDNGGVLEEVFLIALGFMRS
jgi:DnaJ-class molecular chaperone